MTNHHNVIYEYMNNHHELTGCNVYAKNGILFSYGDHFPLAIHTLTDQILINADRSSVSTSKHQNYANYIAGHRGIAIPFSALNAAGIPAYINPRSMIKKLEIIDHSNATWETQTRIDPKTGEKIEYQFHVLGGALLKYNPENNIKPQYFISGLDSTATNRNNGYFLTQLKHSARSLKDAYEQLKPKSIVQAESDGLEILRQGEFFFLKHDPESIDRSMYKKIKKHQTLPSKPPQRTNHIARDTLKISHHPLLVRGTVRHTNGEHKMLNFKEEWWSVHHNNQKQSFSANGGFD